MEPEIRTITVRIETPDGTLPPALVAIPDVPLGLADAAPPLFELCNGVVALAAQKASRAGERISCGSGCGVCCRQLVPVSIPEAFFIRREALLAGGESAAALNRRFASAQDSLVNNGLWKLLESIGAETDQSRIAARYWDQAIPCPFLVNESCAIHAIRPCACREYNILSDPASCGRPLSANVKRLVIHRKMTTALARTAASLLSQPPTLIPLVMIPAWCESHRSLDDLRWDGMEFFDLMLSFALKG